jgi:hypothetical protein
LPVLLLATSHQGSQDEPLLHTLFEYIQSEEELWSLYLQDFVRHSFNLSPELGEDHCTMLISQLKSSELMKTDTVIDQFFGLHAYVSINGLKIARAMPTLQKLRSGSTMSPEDISVDNACDVLYVNLENSIHSHIAELELKKWYNLFMEVVSSLMCLQT